MGNEGGRRRAILDGWGWCGKLNLLPCVRYGVKSLLVSQYATLYSPENSHSKVKMPPQRRFLAHTAEREVLLNKRFDPFRDDSLT